MRAYKTFNKKTSTEYIPHRLVESYLTENDPHQRIIMHLDTLDLPKNQWRHLASILEARLAGQYSLTEDNQELSRLADQLIKRHEMNGPYLLAAMLLKRLIQNKLRPRLGISTCYCPMWKLRFTI